MGKLYSGATPNPDVSPMSEYGTGLPSLGHRSKASTPQRPGESGLVIILLFVGIALVWFFAREILALLSVGITIILLTAFVAFVVIGTIKCFR
jgi:hypothetical protein